MMTERLMLSNLVSFNHDISCSGAYLTDGEWLLLWVSILTEVHVLAAVGLAAVLGVGKTKRKSGRLAVEL